MLPFCYNFLSSRVERSIALQKALTNCAAIRVVMFCAVGFFSSGITGCSISGSAPQ